MLKTIQNCLESVYIDTKSVPANLWTSWTSRTTARGCLQMSWRVSEILETNWDWCGLAFLALLSTELLWLLFYYVSMSDRKTLERKSKSYPAPSQQNVQNERKWTIFHKCLKRSRIAWNRFILILRVSLRISGPPGRPERQLEDVSKMCWRVSEILETNWDWWGLAFFSRAEHWIALITVAVC